MKLFTLKLWLASNLVQTIEFISSEAKLESRGINKFTLIYHRDGKLVIKTFLAYAAVLIEADNPFPL